jgi:hypothetical protein
MQAAENDLIVLYRKAIAAAHPHAYGSLHALGEGIYADRRTSEIPPPPRAHIYIEAGGGIALYPDAIYPRKESIFEDAGAKNGLFPGASLPEKPYATAVEYSARDAPVSPALRPHAGICTDDPHREPLRGAIHLPFYAHAGARLRVDAGPALLAGL